MTVLGVGHDLNFSYCFLFHYLFVAPPTLTYDTL